MWGASIISGGWLQVIKVNIGPIYCYYKHFIICWSHRKDGLDEGKSRGDSHTFDLIKLFTYPHMPPGLFAGHMKDGGLGKDERGRESTPQTWHSARESSMTCREEKRKWPAGISQSERQKSSQLFILAGAKRAPEQVVQPGASGATEEQKKKKRRGRRRWR